MAIYTKPKPHQIEGARFIYKKQVAIIGAKTGKGKTLVALACIHEYVHGKNDYVVVFAPPKAYDKVWKQETKKHTSMKVIDMPTAFERWQKEGSIDFLYEYDILLAKYPQVKADYYDFFAHTIPGRITVYDEAHKLKTPGTKLVRLMSNLTRHARAKWAVTATAIGNSILDLWGIMHFLDSRVLGTEMQFKKRYCVMEPVIIGWTTRFGRKVPDERLQVVDYQNLDELKKIMESYMWTVPSDLNVKFHDIPYEMNELEDRTYLVAAKGILEKDSPKGFAQRMPDLQRVVDGARGSDGAVTVGYRSSKYLEYKDGMARLLSKNESVILFAEFLETFEMLYKLLKEDFPNVPIYRISGTYLDYHEDKVELPCIILSTIGGTESLNLKFANHVMCYSVPFAVNGFIQLVGRITRMDSDYLEDLNVYMPICENNIDRYKNVYLQQNAALINDVLGRDANLPERRLTDMRKGLLSELRKELLWRTKLLSKKN
jgi:SNF2 family DNA or RNA helicase